jgi:glutathione S-transferase
MRARLALLASGQPCELREVLLRDKPASLKAASAKATVPVLVDADGAVIDESLDIMLWALRRNDPQSWLAPADGDQARMMALISECDGRFKPLLDRYKYPQRFDLATGNDCRDQAGAWLAELNSRLVRASSLPAQGACATGNATTAGQPIPSSAAQTAQPPSRQLFGPRICLADAAIFPFVRQFAHVDRAWFAAQPWPALQGWLQAWLDSAIFMQAMHKYAPWVDGTVGIPFPAGSEHTTANDTNM